MPLGLDRLSQRGSAVGLELVSTMYKNVNTPYLWRCKKYANHEFNRSWGEIQSAVNAGLPACIYCAGTKKTDMMAEVIRPCIAARG